MFSTLEQAGVTAYNRAVTLDRSLRYIAASGSKVLSGLGGKEKPAADTALHALSALEDAKYCLLLKTEGVASL